MSAFCNTINRREDGNASLQEAEVVPKIEEFKYSSCSFQPLIKRWFTVDIRPIVKKDFITLEDSATISEMIGALKNYEKKAALIFKNKKYIGLVEKKKLLRTRIDASEAKAGKYVHATPILTWDAQVIDASALLFDANVDILPVEKDKSIVGTVDGMSLAKLGLRMPAIQKLKVSDLQLMDSPKIDANAQVAKVIDAMHDLNIDLVPVFQGKNVTGVISYRDLLRGYLNWTPKRDVGRKFNKMASTRSAEVDMPHLASLPASDFMGPHAPVTIRSKDSIVDALELMSQNKVSGLVVTTGDQYAGILSIRGVLKAIADLKEEQKFAVSYIGLSKLNLQPHQQASIDRIVLTQAPKLERLVNNKFALVIHIKSYDKPGTKQKFSVHMRVEHPGKLITCSDDDWKIETALHKVFEHAENALKGRFHSDSNLRKHKE